MAYKMIHNRFSILTQMAKDKKFSGHIYITDGHESFELCKGLENHVTKSLITKDSVFPIASGTKFLTALAIGMLIDQGKFTLDSYAKDILDLDISSYDPHIQIKHLLSHSSGIPDYLDDTIQDITKIDNLKLLSIEDYISYFPHSKMEFIPGSKFRYNDGAFVYLALIIEKVSHMSYQTFINEYLLKPLNISQSGVFNTSLEKKHKVMGYIDSKRTIPHIGYIPEMAGGDGGAYMNAYDFHIITRSFLDGKIICSTLVKEFMTPQIKTDEGDDIFYGYGLWLKKCNNDYIPYVIGVDAGIRFKSMFIKNHFYFIATNTNDDIWDMMKEMDKILCNA